MLTFNNVYGMGIDILASYLSNSEPHISLPDNMIGRNISYSLTLSAATVCRKDAKSARPLNKPSGLPKEEEGKKKHQDRYFTLS
jgi:hypothetical protein